MKQGPFYLVAIMMAVVGLTMIIGSTPNYQNNLAQVYKAVSKSQTATKTSENLLVYPHEVYSRPAPPKGQKYFEPAIKPFVETKTYEKIKNTNEFARYQTFDQWGYPINEDKLKEIESYVSDSNNQATPTATKKSSLVTPPLAHAQLGPEVTNPRMYCRPYPDSLSYLRADFEDVYETNGRGYDDEVYGEGRREAACEVLSEIGRMLRIDEGPPVHPIIIFTETGENSPFVQDENSLISASSKMNWEDNFTRNPSSGFLHRLLTARGSTSDISSAYVMTNFENVNWDIDSELNSSTYSYETALTHAMLHALGLSSRIPHQHAVLDDISDSTYLHAGFFDMNLYPEAGSNVPFVNPETFLFQGEEGSPSPDFLTNIATYESPLDYHVLIPIYSPQNYDRNLSLSHFDHDRISGIPIIKYVMHPTLSSGVSIEVHGHEKQALCDLGYSVEGYGSDCGLVPVARDDFVDLNDTPIVLNSDGTFFIKVLPFANDTAFSENGQLEFADIDIETINGTVAMTLEDEVYFYSDTNFTQLTPLNSSDGAKAIEVRTRDITKPIYMTYIALDTETRRTSPEARIVLIPCDSLDNQEEYICNGGFETLPMKNIPSHRNSHRIENFLFGHVPPWLPPAINESLPGFESSVPWWSTNYGYTGLVGQEVNHLGENGIYNLPWTSPDAIEYSLPDSDYAALVTTVFPTPWSFNSELITKLKEPLTVGTEYKLTFDAIANPHAWEDFGPMQPFRSDDLTVDTRLWFGNETEPERILMTEQKINEEWISMSYEFEADLPYEYLSLKPRSLGFRTTGAYIDNVSLQRITEEDPPCLLPEGEYVCNGDFDMPLGLEITNGWSENGLFWCEGDNYTTSSFIPWWCDSAGSPSLAISNGNFTNGPFNLPYSLDLGFGDIVSYPTLGSGSNAGVLRAQYIEGGRPGDILEAIQTKLVAPLEEGKQYIMSYDVMGSSSGLDSLAADTAPVEVFAHLDDEPQFVDPLELVLPDTDQAVLFDGNDSVDVSPKDGIWKHAKTVFTANGDHTFLSLYTSTADHYQAKDKGVHIDNVSVRELEEDPECSDGEDNDGDGAVDYPDDLGCDSEDDDDEIDEYDIEVIKIFPGHVLPNFQRWRVYVTNHGPADASNVLLIDELPRGTQYHDWGMRSGPNANLFYDRGSHTAKITIPSLPAGATTEFFIRTKVERGTTVNCLTNYIEVQNQDLNLLNNEDSAVNEYCRTTPEKTSAEATQLERTTNFLLNLLELRKQPMQKGDSHSYVAILKQLVNKYSVITDKLSVTGDFDDATESAVQKLQAALGVKQDGIVTQEFIRTLREYTVFGVDEETKSEFVEIYSPYAVDVSKESLLIEPSTTQLETKTLQR